MLECSFAELTPSINYYHLEDYLAFRFTLESIGFETIFLMWCD